MRCGAVRGCGLASPRAISASGFLAPRRGGVSVGEGPRSTGATGACCWAATRPRPYLFLARSLLRSSRFYRFGLARLHFFLTLLVGTGAAGWLGPIVLFRHAGVESRSPFS